MQVSYHRQFEKDIEKYASPEQIQEIFDLVGRIEQVDSLREITDVKKLAGFKQYYRYRMGEYRIGFSHNETGIRLERFLHRKDIYKRYP